MVSVVTYWSGSSKNAADKAGLIEFLAQLAALSDARSHRGEMPPSNIVQFDHVVTGRVFIGNSMLLLDQFSESIRQSARLIESPEAWQAETSIASLAVFSRADEQRYAIQVPAFRLQGIAFRLYDPRRLYVGEDWMSFSFVHSPDFPELDGQIVHPLTRQACADLDGEWFQRADWVVETPSIHLRYYLEEWFDLLMAWIKIFYVPDLEYWRNKVLNRFDEIKSSIDRLIASEGIDVAKQAVFEYILECFESEADQLENEIARITDEEA